MKDTIKNIIFDFGGVVFQIDEKRTLKAFSQLLGISTDEVARYCFGDQTFLDLECGKISGEDFIQYICSKSTKPITKEQALEAWNAILIGYKPEHVPLLLALKKKYRTFLLSNTNEIHTNLFPEIARRQDLPINSNFDLFEKVWYSNEVGMRKPNLEIFEFALRDAGLKPGETLFVDDLEVNIAAAATLGIRVQQITPQRCILELFSEWV